MNTFNIALNKILIEKNKEYQVILSVISLLKKNHIDIMDDLPIIIKQNKIYLDYSRKNEISKLYQLLEVPNNNHNINELWNLIINRYKLKDYNLIQSRYIAGVKYSMERQGYSFSNPYIISRNLPIENIIKIKELSNEIRGLEIIEQPYRNYILADCAPHIIGNIGPIYAEEYKHLKNKNYKLNNIIGKNGIEKYFEKYLRGIDGERIVNINNQGQVNDIYDKQSPVPGNTVILTIDSKLQYIAQNALQKQIHNLNITASKGKGKEADAGSVVVLDVSNGEILAIASYPSYNIDDYNKNFKRLINNETKPLFNRALLGAYAPGSCYKPAVAIAALQEKIVTSTSTIHCGHIYNYFSKYRPKCLGYHGNINVMDALKVSCNIYFYDVGRLLGINRINNYSRQFGFASPTGIQLPENIGQLASPKLREHLGKQWYPGDVLQAAIGQSDNLISPLQMANYIASIANRGKRMKISIIKQINSFDKKKVIYKNEPKIVCNIKANHDVFETVIEGLSRASRIGTSRRYFGSYPITVPSKTGTPEIKDLCNSTFICFAPDTNPKIAIAVVIEKGWHGYTGAPVAKEILNGYFGYNN